MPQKGWECPFCTYNSSRHWNVQRHISLIHGLKGEPLDHLTRLTRLQLRPRVGMNYWDGNFQQSSSPSFRNTIPYENYENDRDKRFWENFDRMQALMMLKVLKEIRDTSAHIVQQNSIIMSQLANIFNTGRY